VTLRVVFVETSRWVPHQVTSNVPSAAKFTTFFAKPVLNLVTEF
jgi:hypothetical protein